MPRSLLYFQLLLGSLIISWFLWLRLLRKILPREWHQLLNLSLWYTAAMVLMFGLLLILALNRHYGILPAPPSNPPPGLEPVLDLLIWIWESPGVLFAWIWDPWQGPKKKLWERKLLTFMHYLRHRGEGERTIKWSTFIIFVVPKILVSLVFVVEIVVLGRLKILYALLIILILPLMVQTMLYILKKVARDKLVQLDMQVTTEPGEVAGSLRLSARDVNLSQELFDEYSQDWLTCHDFLGYSEDLADWRSNENIIINVLHFYHYFLGWTTLFCCQIGILLNQIPSLVWNLSGFPGI